MISKKVLKVKNMRNEGYGSTYSHSGYMFAFCSKIVNNEVHQRSAFNSCREDLANCLFYNDKNTIHTDRSRYMVRHVTSDPNKNKTEKWFDNETKIGLRIVNIMEKRHGWPLTKMYNVEPSIKDVGKCSYGGPKQLITFQKVLIGSTKWVRSPHMISLYILLFRLPTRVPKKFGSIKTYKGFEEACNKCRGATSGDAYHVATTFKFWDMLMANFGQMFAGTTSKDNFKKVSYKNCQYDEGILKLCRFNSKNEQISGKFVALAKSAGLK